jgi:antitoxin component YwqK of YwqJK toxin-antitoxin module
MLIYRDPQAWLSHLPIRGLMFLAALLWSTAEFRGDEAQKPLNPADQRVGELEHSLPPKDAVPADDPEASKRIIERAAALADDSLEWHKFYLADPEPSLDRTAAAVLQMAKDQDYSRTQAVDDLKKGGEGTRRLIRNLDVGRHQLLKVLYARAFEIANKRLQQDGLSPLQKVQAVNAGGTGDFTRDQDITVFAGDEVREKYFFDAVLAAAADDAIGLTAVRTIGGVDFPQIEVTLFRGEGDLPDARFATDVEEFHLNYQKAIANQAANAEAYKGGGADIEVKGRRIPGKMYVQQFSMKDGRLEYVAETPLNFREARSIFAGTPPERWQRFERAAHIFSDFIQGRQHSHGDDLTKGPLKYAGRAIEHLCELHGMKPWPELKSEDRVALLRKVWPHISPDSEQGKRVFAQVSEALDAAVEVKANKRPPTGLEGEAAMRTQQIALGFLRNSTGATLSRMVSDLLCPPAFDSKTMGQLAGSQWDTMTPRQRYESSRDRSEIFRAATGRASMENLLTAVSMLRMMDFEGIRVLADRPGEQLMAKALQSATPKQRPILELASEYAGLWARRQQTSDPTVRAECDRQLNAVRKRLVAFCPKVGGEMPGEKLLFAASEAGPLRVLAAEQRGRRWLSAEAQDSLRTMRQNLLAAFPSHAEEWKAFRAEVESIGMKTYLGKRVLTEFYQLDTLADALTLVEMYQEKAGWQNIGKYIGINLVSRIHWGIGPLIQAAGVYDENAAVSEERAAALGKNLVFMTLSRVVPWAATVKITFDVVRGTVSVTVGWTVREANAATIDAVYTGEAGRTNEAAAGTVLGRLRDSGVCVLPDHLAHRQWDPESGQTTIAVDTSGMYLHFLSDWMGVNPETVPRGVVPAPDRARLVSAHDRLVHVILDQAAQYGPTWIPKPGQEFFPVRMSEKVVIDASTEFLTQLRERATPIVDNVLAETATRGYRSFMEKEGTDVIREGLLNRFCADLLGGMLETWQVRITSQILAAREIERAATAMDFQAIAEEMVGHWEPSENRIPPLEIRMTSADTAAPTTERIDAPHADQAVDAEQLPPKFEIEARADGVPVHGGMAVSGLEGVHLSLFLKAIGHTGDTEQPVRFEVVPGRLRKIHGDTVNPDENEPLKSGDIAEDVITIRAIAADGSGPVLATRELTVRVLLEEPSVQKIPLFRQELKSPEGIMLHRYEYFRTFENMPSDWLTDEHSLYVEHGKREYFHEDGSLMSVTHFDRGNRIGRSETFHPSGNVESVVNFINNEPHREAIGYDEEGTKIWSILYEKGYPMEAEMMRHAGGSRTRFKVTSTDISLPDGHSVTGDPFFQTIDNASLADRSLVERGEIREYDTNGRILARGTYLATRKSLEQIYGRHRGERFYDRTGKWEYFHVNGNLQKVANLDEWGVQHGDETTYGEDGSQNSVSSYANGKLHGTVRVYGPAGRLEEYSNYSNGQRDGRTEIRRYTPTGELEQTLWWIYKNGKLVDNGTIKP